MQPASALARAKAAARDLNVKIGGGVSTVRQYLRAGLIDDLHFAVSPVALGQGEVIFARIDLSALGGDRRCRGRLAERLREPLPRSSRSAEVRRIGGSRPTNYKGNADEILERAMNGVTKAWDGEQVRKWLERRLEAAKLDQAAADRRGYDAQDDYDKAAAEEWVCRALKAGDCTNEQAAFAKRLEDLIGQQEYSATSIHDDTRFERHVRGQLRKLAKMTKANEGFEKTLRYQ